MTKNLQPLLLFFVLLSVMGCEQKYWFRIKIDVPHSNKYSVKVNVINQSNHLLSKDFEEIMRKSVVKELKKKGYFELPIDSPQFLFTLFLNVDSFNAAKKNHPKEIALYADSVRHNYRSYNQTVKAVMIVCELKHYKQGWVKWISADDVYYFGEYRDIGRVEGVVRHLIRIAKDNQVQSLHSVSHY
jgi:hypothetical protein